MKMSEFTTKSFLGNAGAAENSYILINYEDNTTQRPVTYKASLQEIGKAIANDQKLYKKTQNGAVTTNVSQGAYVNTAAENFASVGYVNMKTYDMITTSNISLHTMGLASTGYVTSAINTAKNDLASVGYVDSRFYGIASEGYVNNATAGLASVNYVTEALEEAGGGFSPLESVTCSVFVEPNASEASQHIVYPVMGDRDGNLFSIYGDDSTALKIRSDIASTGDLSDALDNFSYHLTSSEVGTVGADLRDMMKEIVSSGTAAFVSQADVSSYFVDMMNSYELATTEYVNTAVSTALEELDVGNVQNAASVNYVDSSINNAISGLASEEYVTNAISGLASTGYVTDALNAAVGNIIASEIACLGTSDDKICIRDCQGNFQGFLSAT